MAQHLQELAGYHCRRGFYSPSPHFLVCILATGTTWLFPTLRGRKESRIILNGGVFMPKLWIHLLTGRVPGAIIDQTPKADNNVKEGFHHITILKSLQEVAVPGLVDYSTRKAVALLNLGFDHIDRGGALAIFGLVLAVSREKIAPMNESPDRL